MKLEKLKNPETLFQELPLLAEEDLLEFISESENFDANTILKFLEYIYDIASPIGTGLELYDCCGTGGDKANTFNISTSAAFLSASSGTKVCKNGGRSSSSKTGSVDVLEALGVRLELPFEEKLERLKKFNLAFYSSKVSAELLAPIKKICRKYKRTSFLSLLGPLASPVELEGQVIGVGQEKWIGTMVDCARSLIQAGLRKKVAIVHSKVLDQDLRLDELSSCSSSQVIFIDSGETEHTLEPEDLGINLGNFTDLAAGENSQAAANIVRSVFYNQANQTSIDSVALNTALLNYLAREDHPARNPDFKDKTQGFFQEAKSLILDGNAQKDFDEFCS